MHFSVKSIALLLVLSFAHGSFARSFKAVAGDYSGPYNASWGGIYLATGTATSLSNNKALRLKIAITDFSGVVSNFYYLFSSDHKLKTNFFAEGVTGNLSGTWRENGTEFQGTLKRKSGMLIQKVVIEFRKNGNGIHLKFFSPEGQYIMNMSDI